ncbi:hypothetical protein RclHR1_07210004 [Rhizophagus clarus]|uniref:HMG box domain-containing protein n=1 Tax=Rhizophagus clarus TaxID=94130 RepID=A0A2Z6S7Y6_9GLOM|nr:hypothetical protein RclHR1_07210004 [Rhizophagus clarus]GES82356.1 hypothetical protein GLOIN_2v1775985 [Rhizophagus clarus]
MPQSSFSIDFLAESLIGRMNRKNIFPPLLNDPESFVAPPGSKAKRPPNSFLLCRKNVSREAKMNGAGNMRVISKAASILWNNASLAERKVYDNLSKRVNEIHSFRRNSKNLPSLKYEVTPEENFPTFSHQNRNSFPSTSSSPETFPNIIFNNYHLNTLSNINAYLDDNNQIILFNYNNPDEYSCLH